jgi:hypothetical protein
MKRRRLIALAAVVVGAIGAGVLLYTPFFNALGYCFAEKRYLSDEELILNAARDIFTFYPPKRYGHTGELIRNPIPYRSFEDFFAANKDCCRIVSEGRKGYRPTWDIVFRGLAAAIVEVKFQVEANPISKYKAVSTEGMPPGYVRYHAVVRNCGQVWSGI